VAGVVVLQYPDMCGSRRAVLALLLFALAGSASSYVVRPGDTLSGIARRLGVSVASLSDANGIRDPNRVYAGSSLSVPGAAVASAPAAGRTHTVVAGDNLSRIATKYGTSVGAIVTANGMGDPNHLRIGARLTIPGGGSGGGLPARLLGSPARLALIPHFQRWASANGIDGALVMAVAWHESGWQNDVVSSAGAVGIGQLMPGTARFVSQELIGVPLEARIPADNIRMTARYLRFLITRAGGDVDMALAAYFQGPGSIARQGLLSVTHDYVRVVKTLRPRFADA
jgi:LysM repeat protein